MIFWKIFEKIYQRAAEKMCEEIKIFLKDGKKILDLGCGSAIFGKEVEEKLKCEVLGMDIVDGRIKKIPFLKYNGRIIPFSENYFDCVLIAFVLHHSRNPRDLLEEAKRVGQKVIIFEDLTDGFLGKLRCYFHWFFWNLFFGKEFAKFNFFSEKEWEEIFKKLNLKIIAKKDFSPGFKFLDPVKRKIFILEK